MLKEIGKKISFVIDTLIVILALIIYTFFLGIIYLFKRGEEYENMLCNDEELVYTRSKIFG